MTVRLREMEGSAEETSKMAAIGLLYYSVALVIVLAFTGAVTKWTKWRA